MAGRSTHRLYYDDSTLCDFKARALSCEPLAPQASSALPAPVWAVTLDSTAFYPTSGGQPHDAGKLGDARVLDVREEDGEIVHLVDAPLALGMVQGCVDWNRRFDHMQQHTGQHLLSAMFQERFGLATVSFHLGSEISTIDLRGSEPSEGILEGAERAANQVIFENRPVIVRYAPPQQLAEMGVRKQVEREGILRVIEIAGADLQPCGGTHVRSAGQIGVILVRRCVKIRQDWRVEFFCGGRAARRARADYRLLHDAAERLNSPMEEIVAGAERAVAQRDAYHKSARAVSQRLAEVEAEKLLHEAPLGAEGIRVITRVAEGVEPEYLLRLATELAKSERTIALVARVECGHVIFARHPSVSADVTALMRQVFERVPGKGGGTPNFARGKVADAVRAREVVELGGSLLLAARPAS